MANSSQALNHSRNGKGRQKVKMEKMENKTNLQVTFSKRRYGLFKKASELCTLTGAEMGIIVFSPGRKVFSFGHPSVHKIIDDCFPTEGGERREGARNGVVSMPFSQRQMMCDEWLVDVHRVASVAEQNMRLSMLEMQMEADKRRSMMVMELEKEEMASLTPIDRMMETELVELGARLNALKESMLRTMSYGVMSDCSLNAVSVEMGNPGLNHMDEVKFGSHGFY